MLRVASEVRIFPLLTLMLERSPYVQLLVDNLKSEGFVASVEKVGYELQRGGNEMLRIQEQPNNAINGGKKSGAPSSLRFSLPVMANVWWS